ncbi:hypothetical protein CHH83_02635 [Bacillus sp. 7586-K]|nr:hypothetical protein CHH83_02635 [Bacillus sp. 7586-K]
MLRNVIESAKTVEIYKIGEEVKRGALVTKNTATKTAAKADGEGVQVYIVDFDAQPTGCLSDVEVSQYDNEMDTVKANTLAILVTYGVGGQFATDQVSGTFADGDYAVASAGLFSPAAAGNVSKFKYVGEYLDGDKKLHQFEVVDPFTVA